MLLEGIIPDNMKVSSDIELIPRLDKNDVHSRLKTVAGFANYKGGTFYLGVDESSHELIGYDPQDIDAEKTFFIAQICEHVITTPFIIASFISYNVNNSIRKIIRIDIKESLIKPVILNYKGFPGIFMRRDGYTNGASFEEIIEMSIKSRNAIFDTLYTNIIYNENDFQKLHKTYSDNNNGKVLTTKALRSMGFFNENDMLSEGALLFKDTYTGNKMHVKCSIFSGKNKGGERIVTAYDINDNILNTIEFVINYINRYMNHMMIKQENKRINIDAIPQRALFEAVVNAIVHRDYFLDGDTAIQVDLYSDRLEILSPGKFVSGELKKTHNLSGIISSRRNVVITNILVACNIMEAAGTGFDKIVEEYNQYDYRYKPYIESSTEQFKIVLPDVTSDYQFNDDTLSFYYPIPSRSSEHDEKNISLLLQFTKEIKWNSRASRNNRFNIH